jgi:ABC-type nickel/cobalt efflux system permease component RcnA
MLTALSLGLVHTIIGPDHYLPFIVLGRAEGWTLRKTMGWTFLCGLAHVLSSVLVGSLGVALGWAMNHMQGVEGIRGQLATWALIGFGLVYFLWGLWRGRRGHAHVHVHADGSVHAHPHAHQHEKHQEPMPQHEDSDHDDPHHVTTHQRTRWTLFIIFVLGPCEPLIPLLMVPAAAHSPWGIAAVAAVFGVVTIGTMMALVALGHMGLRALRLRSLERYAHAMAGLTLVISGLAVEFLGI